MKFYGGVQGGKRKYWLNFCGNLSLFRKWAKKLHNSVACPERCASTDPEALEVAFHQGAYIY